ncbi:MAG: L,D-transpeptidase/peptidoglycan binding protein [Coriobacteriales bacterium]|nr:L,D-transpeptidase/peptidoglycan binding protein [Coriobacteriales bacterium]
MLGIVFGVLIAFYGVATYYFSSHFGFNTSIDSINCTFKTVEEVEQAIAQRVDEHEMVIEGRASLSKTIKAADIDLDYVPDGQVAVMMKEQNPFLWPVRLFRDAGEDATLASVKFDKAKLTGVLEKFDLFNEADMKPPVDAYAKFEESQYVIQPEDPGTTLDEARTNEAIDEGVQSLVSTLSLDDKGCYVPPEIFANNPELVERVKTYNTYVPFAITYNLGDETELLDATTAIDWIDIGEGGEGTLNGEALATWVHDFAARHDTVGTERAFKTATGEDATVSAGTYGWKVDQNSEIEAIKTAITNHTGEEREPYYTQTAAVHAPLGTPDWGTTYIELDLTKQHMYYLVDGSIEFEADVVTGAPWGNRATPSGVYSILEMLSPTVLRGEIQANGKREYETPVRYWMRMTWAGHGFHDATWQSSFGGNRYTYAGSHGCINMSYSDAGSLYKLIEVGLPVISHH